MSNENPDVSNEPAETVVSMGADGTLHFTLPDDAVPHLYLGLAAIECDRLFDDLGPMLEDEYEEFLLRLSMLKTAANRWEAWRAGELQLTGLDPEVIAGPEASFGLVFDKDAVYLRAAEPRDGAE